MHLSKNVSNKDITTTTKNLDLKKLIKSIDKGDKIYSKYSRTKNATKKEKLCGLFKTYRNSLKKITNLSKANYYCELFRENKVKLNKV